jgi:ribonuclease BN (tRNA processing enzyme)
VVALKLTVIGCAPSYTVRPGRSSSCYLVEHGSTRIVLDLGAGSFPELWRYASFGDIAAVFISHTHADHNVDLIPLRHWVKYVNRGYGPALHGPAELRARVGQFQAEPEFLSDLHGESLAERTFAVGDLRIEARHVTHIPDSFAFRVSAATGNEPGLVYSGDCGFADDLLPLIRDGDTLLSEAAWGAGKAEVPIHMTASEAAGAAARGGAKNLILTHILDDRRESDARAAADETFGGDVQIARPGLELDIR